MQLASSFSLFFSVSPQVFLDFSQQLLSSFKNRAKIQMFLTQMERVLIRWHVSSALCTLLKGFSVLFIIINWTVLNLVHAGLFLRGLHHRETATDTCALVCNAQWGWNSLWRSILIFMHLPDHGLRTPNEDINQRNLKIWADVADKICFGRT